MTALSKNNDDHRRRAQSLYEYRPRVNTELILALFNKLVSSNNSPLPANTGNLNSTIEPNRMVPTDRNRTIYFLCEPLISGVLLLPLILIFWHSGWNFMLEWLNTDLGQHQATLPSLYLISQIIFLIIYLNQNRIYNFLVKQELKIFVTLILQFHSLITATNYIIQWISMWTLWDYYTSDNWFVMFIISIAAIFALMALTGHPCDLVCAPFVISYDSIEYNIRIGTPFITEKMNEYLSHILNYIFYEFVISLLTILAWRGFYAFFDAHIYPDNENMSAGISLIIGYPLYFILMYTQSFHNKISQSPSFIQLNYPNFLRNFHHLCSFISCVLLWRGFWILFDTHIATVSFAYSSPYRFYIICMISSFIILSLMKTASSVNGPLSHMDDEYHLFPLYSNCLLVKWFNEKKISDENSTQMTKSQPYTITLF